MSCHVSNGPWIDERKLTIELLDKETLKSLRQSDGSFLIEVKRGQPKTILTVIGRVKDDEAPAPYRNAWTYIDPTRIESNSLSKFAPGWAVNLQMSCRLVGDGLPGFGGAKISALPMTLQPLDDAKGAELQVQVMLTKGESIKAEPKKGMLVYRTGSWSGPNVKSFASETHGTEAKSASADRQFPYSLVRPAS